MGKTFRSTANMIMKIEVTINHTAGDNESIDNESNQ